MGSPTSIFPSGSPGPRSEGAQPSGFVPATNASSIEGGLTREGNAASLRDSSLRDAPVDESLIAGAQRRFAALLQDLRDPEQSLPLVVITLLVALLAYSYWPGLLNARASWDNPQYSHGWIVPICALALLFWWRRPITPVEPSARMAGLGLLAGAFLVRLACAYFRIITIDMYTFVPAVAGVVLLTGGWSMFRWAWAPIATLIFMYPLPDEATRYLLGPLQTLATMVSTFALQTMGLDAYREGNRIILGETQVLGVVDACAGLRMLTIFVWLAIMIVLVSDGEWWENLIIACSAIPIALIVNSTRITVTGVMYTINPELAEKIFHDWAGYFMMPMALGLLFAVQWLLGRLVVTEDLAPAAVSVGRGAALGLQAGAGQGVDGAKRPEKPRPAGLAGFPTLPRDPSGKKSG
jgi:exosortase